MHKELALRLAQAHLDALESGPRGRHLVSEKSKLKCEGRDTPLEMREGLAHSLPNHVSEQEGDRPNPTPRNQTAPPIGHSGSLILGVRSGKGRAIRAAYLLGIRKSFEVSPRDDRIFSEVTYPSTGFTERGNEPDRGLAQRAQARGVCNEPKGTTT